MKLKKIKTVIAIVLMAMPCFAIKVYQGVDMSETNVINVPAPIAYTHAVNKEYMDNLAMQATGETNLFSFAVPSKCAGGQISGYTPVSNEDLNISMQFGVNWSTNTRFIVDSTGSNVYDSLTGLMWTKNANDAGEKNWTNAIAYCEALDYGGFDDWRMPNRNELASLIDYSQINPAIPLGHPFTSVNELMTDGGNQNYWTGSTYAKDTEKAWFVSFINGRLYYFGKGNSLHTWAVRNSVIPFVLQINSPNNGNDYISTTFGSHETNIVGTVSVIPDSLEYTNLFTGVGGSLPPSKTFNFANELQVGTNDITVYATRGADSEEVSITITVLLPLQVEITSPNGGTNYISTTAGSHETNIVGTVNVIPDSLVFTNLSTGVGGSLERSKTFNFVNMLQAGTNNITVYADRGADSEEVSITITVPPALQVNITSPNNGDDYISATAGSHNTNIVGTVNVIPDSLVFTNLSTGVNGSLSLSKTFNFVNMLQVGTNNITVYAGREADSEEVSIIITVLPVLQVNITSPNGGNDYISTTAGSHIINIVGTVSVTPNSLVYTNLFTGVGNSLSPSKTFNFANELLIGTNNITIYAVRGADSEEVSIIITVPDPVPWNERPKADPDIVFQPIGPTQGIDTLEWDLQSFPTVSNLQYTPFYCSETQITAAQYCRFLNAYKDRFTNKIVPDCTVTSVFNEAKGGRWVEAGTMKYQLCVVRDKLYTSDSNSYSKIRWNEGNGNYEFNVNSTETNEPMTEVPWYGAVAYCQWLNDVEFGSDTTKWKYRLSTQFEYEFMMGAKTVASSSDGIQNWESASWKYGNSSDLISQIYYSAHYVNFYFNTYNGIVVVGNKGGPGQNSKNVFGCYELSGNLWNWCLDLSDVTSEMISGKDYVNKSGSDRITRGGGWNRSLFYCVTSNPGMESSPTLLNSVIGFRVIRSR